MRSFAPTLLAKVLLSASGATEVADRSIRPSPIVEEKAPPTNASGLNANCVIRPPLPN
jgi:hypothetical protein